MNLIRLSDLEYPRSLWQVRQDNPNVSFPAEPTDDDLAPFDHANVHPTPQPLDWDQRTQRIEEAPPVLSGDGTYCQAWTVCDATTEEIAAWDAANAPAPDWATFRGALLISEGVAQVMAAARSAGCEPGVTALPVALERAQAGDVAEFRACWALVAAAGQASSALIAELSALATSCNLPAEFVAALTT